MEKPELRHWSGRSLRRPLGRPGLLLLIAAITTAPAVLFFDPVWPGEHHVSRDPIDSYLIYSDDIAYIDSSRTLDRAVSHLFVPHNTHIVPAWRLSTWALVALAGKLERAPAVLAIASYSILVAVMLMTGRLIARETGRTAVGLAAMILIGTTSLMLTPATWYSAGQPFWAGFGILATLWYAQSYRRTAQKPALMLAMISAMLAGWFWTVGHLAGPVAAIYLWVDGRRRCRFAAAAPLFATAIAVGLTLALGARRIDSTISFHGRTAREAASPVQGLFHTLQAIPENLVFGNLGLAVHTTAGQGAVLTLVLVALWLSRLWFQGRRLEQNDDRGIETRLARTRYWPVSPLEAAGAALVVGSYLVEWTFRGYMDYQYLRTINIRVYVPWYDVIPQIGAVILTTCWWAETRTAMTSDVAAAKPRSLTRLASLGLLALLVTMLLLHRPRVDFLVRESVPHLLPSEKKRFPIPGLQTMRASFLLLRQAEWQRTVLRRLDHVQEIARRMDLGRDTLRAALGHRWLPGNRGPLQPELYDFYDAIALVDVPDKGRPASAMTVRVALAVFFPDEKEPRPEWIAPNVKWPPEEVVAAP